jgi:hypothetical protein
MSSAAFPAPHYFSTLSIKCTNFVKCFEHKMCLLIFSTAPFRDVFHSRQTWARYNKKIYICRHVNHCYSGTSLTELEFSLQIFQKHSNIKFHNNTSSIRDVPCGQTWQKLIYFFHNSANAPIAAITTL